MSVDKWEGRFDAAVRTIDRVVAERDAANARADQAIRFAAQVEEECARLTRELERCATFECHTYKDGAPICPSCIARAALTPITHDLPSDTETGA